LSSNGSLEVLRNKSIKRLDSAIEPKINVTNNVSCLDGKSPIPKATQGGS
jgi:hypothetical protein